MIVTAEVIKPDNVMLIPDPEPDDPWRLRLKLLDFGVAKVTTSTTGNPRENTQNSTLLGTQQVLSSSRREMLKLSGLCLG